MAPDQEIEREITESSLDSGKEIQNLRQDIQRLRQKQRQLEISLVSQRNSFERRLRNLNRKLETLQMKEHSAEVKLAQLYEALEKAKHELADGFDGPAQGADDDIPERVQMMQLAHREAIEVERDKQWAIEAFFRKVLSEALEPAEHEPIWTHKELQETFFDVSLHSAQYPRNTDMPLGFSKTRGSCVKFCDKRYMSAGLDRPIFKSTFPGLLLAAMTASAPTTTAMRSDLHALDSRIMCYIRPWEEQCQSLPADNNVYAHLIQVYILRCMSGMRSTERGSEFAHLSCLVTEILCLMVPPPELIEALIVACGKALPRSILGAAGVLRVLQCLRSDMVSSHFAVGRYGKVVRKTDRQWQNISSSETSESEADSEEDDTDVQSSSSGPIYAHDNQSLEIILPSFDDDRFKKNAVLNNDLCLLDMPSFLQEVCKGNILGPKPKDAWSITECEDMVLVAENGEQMAWLRGDDGKWTLTDSPVCIDGIHILNSVRVIWRISSSEVFQAQPAWGTIVFQYAMAHDPNSTRKRFAALGIAGQERRKARQMFLSSIWANKV